MVSIKKVGSASLAAAIALSLVAGSGFAAMAQDATGGPDKVVKYGGYKRLTVRRRLPPPAPVAPAPAPLAAPFAAAGAAVALPFNVLGNIFPGPNAAGPRRGGVTAVRFAHSGPQTQTVYEGWATPVPVDASGPIYVVENGDPSISPGAIIGAPIAAAGAAAQMPFVILGAPFRAPGT